MLTTLRQREKREGLKLVDPDPPFRSGTSMRSPPPLKRNQRDRTRLDPDGLPGRNITGQITPVKAVCEMARAKGIETIVDGAHSPSPSSISKQKKKDLGCDYFGTSLRQELYALKALVSYT